MAPTGECHRILQIHPTRRCNLRCLHCYSFSSPEERDALERSLLTQAIRDASTLGYNAASFSGGEPLLYKHLRELLEVAHQCSMLATVASNGMLLDERRLEMLQGAVDLLAISIDGIPSFHNRMRGNDQAFEMMASRLEGLRQSGIPFGFIFTLTQYNFRQLDWVANFAVEQGAKLLQIHPLEEAGRAKEHLAGVQPKQSHAAYAYVKAMHLQEAFGNKISVQVDLFHQEAMRLNPSSVYADVSLVSNQDRPLGEILSPLVIEADGTVVPLQHGFARKYALGNLQEASLPKLASSWQKERYPAFLKLCQQVYEQVTAPTTLPITDWYDAIAHQAQKASDLLVVEG